MHAQQPPLPPARPCYLHIIKLFSIGGYHAPYGKIIGYYVNIAIGSERRHVASRKSKPHGFGGSLECRLPVGLTAFQSTAAKAIHTYSAVVSASARRRAGYRRVANAAMLAAP